MAVGGGLAERSGGVVLAVAAAVVAAARGAARVRGAAAAAAAHLLDHLHLRSQLCNQQQQDSNGLYTTSIPSSLIYTETHHRTYSVFHVTYLSLCHRAEALGRDYP